MRCKAFALIGFLFLAAGSPPSLAETSNAYFHVDSFSFFFAESVQAGGMIPTISIPIRLTQVSDSSWTISIEAGDFSLAPITLPNNTRVQWTLLSQATGQVELSAKKGSVSIAGRFKARSLDSTRQAVYDLSLTTGTARASVGSTNVSREGYAMDRSSGYLQIVAAAVDPPGSEHGIPFFAVIGGRLVGTPTGFLDP